MFAAFDRFKADYRVGMIGSGYDHSIYVFLIIKHEPVVLVLFRLRIKGKNFLRCLPPVDIAQSNNIFCLCNPGDIPFSHPGNADSGNI